MGVGMACSEDDVLDILISDDEFGTDDPLLPNKNEVDKICSDNDVEMVDIEAKQLCDIKKPVRERLTFPKAPKEDNVQAGDDCDNDCHTSVTKPLKSSKVKACVDDDPRVIGSEIASKLKERKFHLITKVVEVLGFNTALEMLQETKRIESNGGMMTSDGKRRRSPGGVYLHIMKEYSYATAEQVTEIYKVDKELSKDATKAKKKRQMQRKKAQMAALKKELLGPEKED